jgi:hypothetical protein
MWSGFQYIRVTLQQTDIPLDFWTVIWQQVKPTAIVIYLSVFLSPKFPPLMEGHPAAVTMPESSEDFAM